MDERYKELNLSRRMVMTNRDALFNAILTISAGALVSSLSLLNYFETPVEVNLLKSAWIALLVCTLSNIVMRYLLSEISIIDLNKQNFLLDYEKSPHEYMTATKFIEEKKPGKAQTIFYVFFFWLFWLSFVAGLSFVFWFVIIII